MKKISSILLTLIMLIVTTNSYSLSSGPFSFSGGLIPHKGYLPLSLDGLPFAILKASCEIINPNFNKPYPVIITFQSQKILLRNLSINGKSASQIKLDNYTNKLEFMFSLDSKYDPYASNRKPYYALIFANLDDSDDVTITNCTAVYYTG